MPGTISDQDSRKSYPANDIRKKDIDPGMYWSHHQQTTSSHRGSDHEGNINDTMLVRQEGKVHGQEPSMRCDRKLMLDREQMHDMLRRLQMLEEIQQNSTFARALVGPRK